ncbi:MAG: DUF4256 domain-containing protein [Chitinophagales bacterium]
MKTKTLNHKETEALLQILERRFNTNTNRHSGITWKSVANRLEKRPERIWSLQQMELTGGEPDVIGITKKGEFIFVDCSPESPKERRSCCYDRKALDARKENKPKHSALEMAAAIGVELLEESEYRHLQQLDIFDQKTSSWIATPESIRKLGGALFCDRRYDTVFVYHNGAESYYAARGWRGKLLV